MLQLTLDGAEALDHNPLPDVDALLTLHLAVVSARRDEGVAYGVRLRVADQHDGEHVRLLGVKVGQRGDGRRLAVSPSLPHDSHGRLRCTTCQEEFLQAIELPVSAVAFRVIHGRNEVGLRCGNDAPFDEQPRRHEVGKGDDAEVVSHRCAEQCASFLESADARQHLHLYVAAALVFHLKDEGGHAVNARVAGADDADGAPFLSRAEGFLGTASLLLHAAVYAECIRGQVCLNEGEIVMIADNRVAVSECIDDGRRDVACRSGPDAGHNDSCLIHLGVVKIYLTKNGGCSECGTPPLVI